MEEEEFLYDDLFDFGDMRIDWTHLFWYWISFMGPFCLV